MFTTDTSRCRPINVDCSGNPACSDDHPEFGVCVQQSKRVSHALLHGKSPIDASSTCCIYVGGVTIWLVRRCTAAVVSCHSMPERKEQHTLAVNSLCNVFVLS